jgi:hypothetical protein
MRLTGDMDGARRLMRRAIEQFRTMGIQTMAAACENYLAWAEVSHGDPGGSLPGLRKAEAELARLGERGFRSTVQATLAQVYERLGECQRARAAVDLADELTGSEDHLNKVLIFTVRARLALAGDDPDAAEAWARKAVEHALRTDISFMKGDAHLELARVLFKREHRPEARAAAQAAIGFYEIRDDQPRAGQARAVLARINFPVSSARPVTA